MTDESARDRVEVVGIDRVLDLRVRILRRGTPVTHAHYSEDDDPTAVHLAIVRDSEVVAVSSWIPRPYPAREHVPAVQLKGMAVDDTLQRSGVGRTLLDAGIEHAASLGAQIVWARARDSALGFYEACGFSVEGDGFMDDATGMSHHFVVTTIA